MVSASYTIKCQLLSCTNVPGIWNAAQIAVWKKVRVSLCRKITMPCSLIDRAEITDTTTHADGSCIFLQLWALGRAANPAVLKQEDGYDLGVVALSAPSPIPLSKGLLLGTKN